ncbi:MAG: Fe-S cluster assembly protein NifU [Candidatus Glassbacteria bacterium GWA2_58_10]|uniref:Nitrogen fixation protein NifU n=1 Tax=Candidatus Glassbacteria bacterium GWA2_58_10 TaxID=1817865 RepID=A0A1F5YEI0_9BACT|nr:MAG: Fe-S cluster assembly protein NifU [Candidatus Glassbacteria bacterium GWA2_58_10]
MWDYTDKVMDHFRNPKNVGYIKDADGVGEVGSLACGDALRLMFKLDDQKRIAEVKFQTFGCGSAIASSSALTELIRGKTLDEAEKITNQDIVDYLGGLPEQKMHCSVMGREALEAAIENYRNGTTVKKELEGRVVCICFGVTEPKIRAAIAENGLTTVAEVTNYTKAGGGCGGCIPELEGILAEMNRGKTNGRKEAKAAAKPVVREMTNLQRIRLVEETIEKDIRPELQKHGGDLELVDIVGNKVTVILKGSCSACGMTRFTLQTLVEPRLRQHVAKELVVVEAL